MRRQVNLNSYLPQVVGGAAEIREMNRVEDEELTALWGHADRVFWNRWILSADEIGLQRYESLLGISPQGDLGERRKTAHYEWNKYIKYTDRSVRALLAQLLGEDGFYMEIYYDRYVVGFTIMLRGEATDVPGIYRKLRMMIPANMGIELAVEAATTLELRPEYSQYKFRYIMCNEPWCGMWPYPATKGLVFRTSVGVQAKDAMRTERIRMASPSSHTVRELIYPVEKRDFTMIVDGGSAGTIESIPRVIESKGVK